MAWQLVGRETELKALLRAVADGGGAVIAGPAGVGKTRLAAESVDRAAPDVRWVATTSDAATIPYGPLAASLPGLSPTLIEGSSGFDLIREELHGVTTLVVDDAHLLDSASATLIQSLALQGSLSVVVTIRVGEPVPEPITSLWKDVGLFRVDLGPLAREPADELVQLMLGERAGSNLLDTVWRLSRGGPLEIRELVFSARELGVLDIQGDVWVLTGDWVPTQRVSDLIQSRLGRLTDDDKGVAELLAYAEATDLSFMLELADHAALDRMERSGIVASHPSGAAGSAVELAHPLYGEVLRSGLPAARRRELARMLSEAAESSNVAVDPLRWAIWRLDAGLADAAELAGAGRTAVGRMAYPLALRLGMASLEQEESYRAHTVVAAALAESGDLDEAEGHFRRAYEMAPNPLYAEWALFGLAWYLFADRPQAALDLVRKEIAKESDTEILNDLRAGLAMLLMHHGEYGATAELTTDLLDNQDLSSQAGLLALVARSRVDAVSLRPGDAVSAASSVTALIEQARTNLPNAEDLLQVSLVEADLTQCRLQMARERVEHRLENTGPNVDRGLWKHMDGRLQLSEGRAATSYESQLSAARALDRSDPAFTAPLALAEAAHAAAAMGRHDIAVSHLDAISPALAMSPLVRSLVDHVKSLLEATTGSLDHSVGMAVEVGDEAADRSDMLQAARCWHLAVRLGRPGVVTGRLAALAEETRTPLSQLYAHHADRLAAGDIEELEAVGRRFDGAGFSLLAAEAFAQAAAEHRQLGQQRRARRATAAAMECLPDDSGARTPALVGLVDAPPLTDREREIALLATSGLSSRDIADRLDLSVRTVDNHLGSVYSKVGSPAELS